MDDTILINLGVLDLKYSQVQKQRFHVTTGYVCLEFMISEPINS
jgi:hypothetical protein